MKKSELVFVPVPALGHLTSTIELAKHLLDQDERLSITVLLIPPLGGTDLGSYTKSLAASDARIRYTMIPPTNHLSQPPSSPMAFEKFASLFIESHKSHVERAVMELLSDDSTRLVGFVLDMFCCCMIDVANTFKVPSYIIFSSNTVFLGFLLHLPERNNKGEFNFNPSDPDSVIPCLKNPVPANVLPGAALDKPGGGYETFLYLGTRFQESKGIIINSFVELEPYAVNSMVSHPITVYPVGPLLDHKINHNKSTESTEIKNWLDNQPSKSVIFLCFGSMGSFKQPQIEQIAMALEKSDHRFLWSMRQPPPEGMHGAPTDYTSYEKVLPNGFLARVKDRGMVCGWAPQVEVLAHEAIKGFVSHCGWNSILESLWYGVPIATWPLNAEQQMNAFYMVRELGLAVELSLAYRSSRSEIVMADQIKTAINCLMDDTNPMRERVKKISEESRKAFIKGGSSLVTLGKLVEDMLENLGEIQ
ncbi:unnamed protein product [Lactuca virosa]|uniref:Glycosyltransferase n=1 Tax=Lactuca virosa TaxID=75947 RepID=A0AAU9P4X1_9ASTR|nr:unnamed protein product [Lactuca virosa]